MKIAREDRKVVYLPHPVSPEMKAAVLSQGGRILDIQFAPPDAENVATPEQLAQAEADMKAAAEAEALRLAAANSAEPAPANPKKGK